MGTNEETPSDSQFPMGRVRSLKEREGGRKARKKGVTSGQREKDSRRMGRAHWEVARERRVGGKEVEGGEGVKREISSKLGGMGRDTQQAERMARTLALRRG